MSHPIRPNEHLRALRATRAVTLGGLALAAGACGTTPIDGPDVGTDSGNDAGGDTTPDTGDDTTPDTPLDTAPDTPIDVAPTCSIEEDGVCPEGCTTDDDADCCVAQNVDWEWCYFNPEWGCECAVEGPFAPPSFGA